MGGHRAAEDATERAREREIKRVAVGLLLDRRARHAATVDALLAAVEVAFAELREIAPAITHMAFELGLGDLPGFSSRPRRRPSRPRSARRRRRWPASSASHDGPRSPASATPWRAPRRTAAPASTAASPTAARRNEAARARVEAQAEHTAAVRTARAEAAAAEARA